jgi:uncharacterized membrane protein YidH (DUF202 family)
MKAATIIGVILIILGIVGFAMGGLSFTEKKKDVSMGPVQISHKEHKTLPISPVLSTISLIAGVGLVVVGARSK